jgi:NAD(P)-dependent dehydrogenase (short-subunit alcohol dehydrogenase family)
MSRSDRERFEVSGRTTFITGAARGIGAATAERLHAKGANVALVGLEPERLAALSQRLGEARTMWVEADVTDFDALQRAVDACVARFGGIDIAIANAGLAFMGTLAHAPIEQVERTFAVNFLGVWRTNRAVIEQITARRGYLLNITSLSAVAHGPLMGPYTATKAGVEALTNSLRMETAPSGARVGCAYFGFVDTDLVKGSDSQPAGQSLNERLPAFMRDPLPVASAVDAIERGIERRAARFWAPRWVGPMIALRGLLQPLTERRTLQDPASLIADMRLADSSNQESQSDILLGLAAAALEQHRPAAGSFRTEG